MYRSIGVLAVSIAITATASAQEADTEMSAQNVAENYLAAYSTQDWETVRALYAEDAVFIDPTSLELGFDNPIEWTGADEIITGIGGWGVSELHYQIHNTYESSGRVVFQADAVVTYPNPDGDVLMNYPITTIITVTDGLVTEHRDYTDFAGASRITED
jgi:ketosteroid isomerase-like protein